MRNPLRTEAEMFRFLLVSIGVAVPVAVAGILGGGWAALGVLGALVVALYVFARHRLEPDAPEPATWARRGPEGEDGRQRRLLVVANETLVGARLHDEIRRRLGGDRADVLVVAPALNSRLRHWTSDSDRALGEARARLDASLDVLRREGIDAQGQVGDADPLQALQDALRTFNADEVVISTHPPARSNWLERDVVGRAREILPIPVAHVVVDLDREPVVASLDAAVGQTIDS